MRPSIAIKNKNLKPLHSGNAYPVQFRAFFDVKKTTENTCYGFGPRSNMVGISFTMGMSSYLNWSHRTVGTPILFFLFKKI